MKRLAFVDQSRWWIYRSEAGDHWDVSSPCGPGVELRVHEFPTGAQALAAFAAGAS